MQNGLVYLHQTFPQPVPMVKLFGPLTASIAQAPSQVLIQIQSLQSIGQIANRGCGRVGFYLNPQTSVTLMPGPPVSKQTTGLPSAMAQHPLALSFHLIKKKRVRNL